MPEYPTIPPESSENGRQSSRIHIISNLEELDLIGDIYTKCKRLAESRFILNELLGEIPKLGLVGEWHNAAISYLVMTSRNLERPLSLVVKGQQSSGKSNLIDTVARFFPTGDTNASTTLSNTAIAYDESSYEHKIVIVHELAGMGEYLVFLRELMSRGYAVHRVSQEQKRGSGYRTEVITKKGPISLVSTTPSLNLVEDFDTRVITVGMDESKEQTRRIARSSKLQGGTDISSEWVFLQDWLDTLRNFNGPFRVDVPYRVALVDSLPDAAFDAVRMRRDFEHLITMIESHAVLHQAMRNKSVDGIIEANFDDYAVARELMDGILGDTLGLVVPDGVKQVVDAVQKLAPNIAMQTNILKIANFTSQSDKTVRRSVSLAVKHGYLRGETDFRTKKLLLSIDDSCVPLPRYLSILPTVDALRSFYRK